MPVRGQFMPLPSLYGMHILLQAVAVWFVSITDSPLSPSNHANWSLNFSQSGSVPPVFRSHLLYLKQLC